MAKIHVLGASGSGTTTIAKVLAKKLGYVHLDTDSYFWEETDIPVTHARKKFTLYLQKGEHFKTILLLSSQKTESNRCLLCF